MIHHNLETNCIQFLSLLHHITREENEFSHYLLHWNLLNLVMHNFYMGSIERKKQTLESWAFKLNRSKPEHIERKFSKRRIKDYSIVTIDGRELSISNQFRHLGFIIKRKWTSIVMSTIEFKLLGSNGGTQRKFYVIIIIVLNIPDMTDISPQYIIFWIRWDSTLRKGSYRFMCISGNICNIAQFYDPNISANIVHFSIKFMT